MNSHKEPERFYLSRFNELCPEFPDGSIEDSESPDFLVHSSDGIVGIELTAVYCPEPIMKKKKRTFSLQAIEKERDKIVDRIKELYLAQGASSLLVSMHFSGNVTDTKGIKDEDLKAIAVLIKEYQPMIGNTVYFPDCLESDKTFPDWLAHVSIFGLNQGEENFWTAPGSAWIPTLAALDIQKRITKKEEKYPFYRGKCSSAWLVLMTQVGQGLGTHVNFSTDVWTHRYETLFEQVWIFQNPNLARKLEVLKHSSEQDKL